MGYPTVERALADLRRANAVRCLGRRPDAQWERIETSCHDFVMEDATMAKTQRATPKPTGVTFKDKYALWHECLAGRDQNSVQQQVLRIVWDGPGWVQGDWQKRDDW